MTEPAPDAAQWHKLDGRMLVVAPLQHLVRLLPVLLILLITGRGDPLAFRKYSFASNTLFRKNS